MNCCFRIADIARATPSISALMKLSVTASPLARAGAFWANANWADSSEAHSMAAAMTEGSIRLTWRPEAALRRPPPEGVKRTWGGPAFS